MPNSAGANASRITKLRSFMIQTCIKAFAVATSIYVSLSLFVLAAANLRHDPVSKKDVAVDVDVGMLT